MHRRRNFSKETKRLAFERSGGICECHLLPNHQGCGRPLGPGNTFYEHINPDALNGSNDLYNCAALTKTCWRLKTNTYDLPRIAKSNRVRDQARGIRPTQFRPLPGTKASGIAKPFIGEPYWRDSGLPLVRRR